MPTHRCGATFRDRLRRRKLFGRTVMRLEIFIEMETKDVGDLDAGLDCRNIDQGSENHAATLHRRHPSCHASFRPFVRLHRKLAIIVAHLPLGVRFP